MLQNSIPKLQEEVIDQKMKQETVLSRAELVA